MSGRNQSSDFLDFLNFVSDADRGGIAKLVRDAEQGSFEGIQQAARVVLAGLLEGKVHPEVAKQARSLLEVEMMAEAGRLRRDGVVSDQSSSVVVNLIQSLEQAQPKAIEAKYTIAEPREIPEKLPVGVIDVDDS